jgi:hypothetical protein
LSEFTDPLGAHDRVNLDAVLERVYTYTWRLSSSEFRDALGGYDPARVEEYMEAVNLEVVVWEGGTTGAETLFII